MKIQIISVALILVSGVCFSQDKNVEALKKLNSDWLNSYVTKDAGTLDRIFAEDFILISHTGAKMTKRNIIDNLTQQQIVSVKVDSIDVKLLTADVGVVTAYTTFVVSAEGKEMTGQNCYQDIYVKRKGKWVAAHAHVTLLNFK